MEPVIIRQTRFSAYFAAIVVSILSLSFSCRISYTDQLTWVYFVVVPICTLSIYLWIKAILNLPVVIMSDKGVMHNKKTIAWLSIKSYSTTRKKRRKSTHITWIMVLDNNKEYTIDITDLTTDPDQLTKLISTFSTNGALEYKGHFNV